LWRRDRRIDAPDPAVRADDEGGANPKTSRSIAKRRLDRRRVAGRDSGAEAKITGKQLRRILQLARTLLPQAVVNRAARLQLAFDLLRRGA
jgi:hypothetical protein